MILSLAFVFLGSLAPQDAADNAPMVERVPGSDPARVNVRCGAGSVRALVLAIAETASLAVGSIPDDFDGRLKGAA